MKLWVLHEKLAQMDLILITTTAFATIWIALSEVLKALAFYFVLVCMIFVAIEGCFARASKKLVQAMVTASAL